jgi:translation initiation factor 2B subunit (eIF-2B alpha/beta/delta family)
MGGVPPTAAAGAATDSWGCVDWLQGHGVDALHLKPGAVTAAARRCVLALLEATAVGPDGFLAATGSAALAAAAREAKRPVWLVAGVGRVLPGPLYDALVRRVGDDPAFEVVPLAAVDEIAGPGGPEPRGRLARPSVPVAAELLRFSG